MDIGRSHGRFQLPKAGSASFSEDIVGIKQLMESLLMAKEGKERGIVWVSCGSLVMHFLCS